MPTKPKSKIRYIYPKIFLITLFLLVFFNYKSDLTCISNVAREQCFKEDYGEEVYHYTKNYIAHSLVIAEDIGKTEYIFPRRWGHSGLHAFQDFSAQLDLEIHGSKGNGMLELSIIGQDYKHLDQVRRVSWQFSGKKVPLDEVGNLDVFKLEYEAENNKK